MDKIAQLLRLQLIIRVWLVNAVTILDVVIVHEASTQLMFPLGVDAVLSMSNDV